MYFSFIDLLKSIGFSVVFVIFIQSLGHIMKLQINGYNITDE